jgi:hypothetical protein
MQLIKRYIELSEVSNWMKGKEKNIRALLASLEIILWPEIGWKPVSLGQLITAKQVKVFYMKAVAKVHPDKVYLNN